MEEWKIFVDNAQKNLLIRKILQDTEELLTKESNILADNVEKNLQIREIFQDTEEQLIKESSILAEIIKIFNFPFWKFDLSTVHAEGPLRTYIKNQ